MIISVAFKTPPQDTTWPAIAEVWRVADDIEVFESGWTSDHFYPVHSDDPSRPRLEGWMTLAGLAQVTSRLRFGTMVTGIPYRHPAVLANMAATLDVMSGGRLELGVGAGWNEEESSAYGIELGTPRQRSDRFEEACAILVDMLGPAETTTFRGRYYQLEQARCFPKPVQRPHPPLCVGGSGARRTLRTTARFAQHWNFDTGTPERFGEARAILHQHCADLGRDPAEITASVQVRYAGDPAATAATAASFADVGADLAIVSLPAPHSPDVLEPLAVALADLG